MCGAEPPEVSIEEAAVAAAEALVQPIEDIEANLEDED